MSSLTYPLKAKFLFDENVDKRLERFFKEQKIDIISKPKELSNGELAKFSKSEQRVFVTNDRDFAKLTKKEIFSVILLRIPQRKIESSIKIFAELISKTKPEKFEGKLIILCENKIEISELA